MVFWSNKEVFSAENIETSADIIKQDQELLADLKSDIIETWGGDILAQVEKSGLDKMDADQWQSFVLSYAEKVFVKQKGGRKYEKDFADKNISKSLYDQINNKLGTANYRPHMIHQNVTLDDGTVLPIYAMEFVSTSPARTMFLVRNPNTNEIVSFDQDNSMKALETKAAGWLENWNDEQKRREYLSNVKSNQDFSNDERKELNRLLNSEGVTDGFMEKYREYIEAAEERKFQLETKREELLTMISATWNRGSADRYRGYVAGAEDIDQLKGYEPIIQTEMEKYAIDNAEPPVEKETYIGKTIEDMQDVPKRHTFQEDAKLVDIVSEKLEGYNNELEKMQGNEDKKDLFESMQNKVLKYTLADAQLKRIQDLESSTDGNMVLSEEYRADRIDAIAPKLEAWYIDTQDKSEDIIHEIGNEYYAMYKSKNANKQKRK